MEYIKKYILYIMQALFQKKNKKWNTIIDNYTYSLKSVDDKILKIHKKEIYKFEIERWLIRGGLERFIEKECIHKKGLEFFLTAHLLQIKPYDSVLDAAGGLSGYLSALRLNGHLGDLYLTDHIFNGIHRGADGVNIVGGDITDIHLPDCSLDKVACHHAFEHFQDNKDIRFIKELNRILKPGGEAVVTPIFLADKYIECWNILRQTKFDDLAELVIDKTASIPGGDEDGHFARIYNLDALEKRVLSPAKQIGFDTSLVELTVDGQIMPDMNYNFGSKLNSPLRALVLKK